MLYQKYYQALKNIIKKDSLLCIINDNLKIEIHSFNNYKNKLIHETKLLNEGYDNIENYLNLNFKIKFSKLLKLIYETYLVKLKFLKQNLETKKSTLLIKNFKIDKKNKIKKKIIKVLAKFKLDYYYKINYTFNYLKINYFKLVKYLNKIPDLSIFNIKKIKSLEINMIDELMKFKSIKNKKILDYLENLHPQFNYFYNFLILNKGLINYNLKIADRFFKYYDKNNSYLFDLNEIVNLQFNYIYNSYDLLTILHDKINFEIIIDLFNNQYKKYLAVETILLKDNKTPKNKISKKNIDKTEDMINNISINDNNDEIITKFKHKYMLNKGHSNEEKQYFESIKKLLNGVCIYYKNKKLIKSRSFNPFLFDNPKTWGFSSTFWLLNLKDNSFEILYNKVNLKIKIENIKKIIISINTKEFIKYILKNTDENENKNKYFEIGIIQNKNPRLDILIDGFKQFKYLMNSLIVWTKKKNIWYQISKKIIKL